MTYISELDPESPARYAAEAHVLRWDDQCPDWETLSVDPESRSLVSESDVDQPDAAYVRRYGSDDPGRVIPGRDGWED